MVVSHDREFLDEVATDILYMHSEKLDYYKGNFSNFHGTKEERRKAQIREYESQQEYRKHLQDFIDRWRYNAKRAPQAQSKIKILEKLPVLELPEDEKLITFQFPNPDALSPPILQMSEVTFGYTPEKTIIRNVNIDLRMDSRIAVVGPNGAGKSTMLKLLTEENKPTQGLVHRNGRLRIAYFTQHHIDQLDLTKSAVGFMADRFPGKTEEEYRRHLGSFGITGMVGLQIMKTLSGGQKSRVAFACLNMQNPHILVLDEVSVNKLYICKKKLLTLFFKKKKSLRITWIWNQLMLYKLPLPNLKEVSSLFLTMNDLLILFVMKSGFVKVVCSTNSLEPSRTIKKSFVQKMPLNRNKLIQFYYFVYKSNFFFCL